jgi:hypothetical protein
MGWTDLFKSKAAKAKPDPRVRWFGKLPTYADYYQSPTDAEWAVEFNEWVLKGFELYYSRCKAGAAHRLQPAMGAVRLSKSAMTALFAALDYGGDMRGRPFPLCFYVGVPSLQWPGPTGARVAAGLRAMDALLQLRDVVSRYFKVPSAFEQTFGGREVDVTGLDAEHDEPAWLEAGRKLTLSDWYAAVAGCLKASSLADWHAAALAAGESIRVADGEEFGPTFRFPLVMDRTCDAQVAGWLHWLGHRMKLDERFLTLFVSADAAGATGRLAVIGRELLADDFLLLTPQAGTLAFVDDFCALGAARDGGSPAAGSSSPRADRCVLPATWADFVNVKASG